MRSTSHPPTLCGSSGGSWAYRPSPISTGYAPSKRAILLIETDLSVAAVGARVGWDDPTYVSRRFKACFAMTPAEYRSAFRLRNSSQDQPTVTVTGPSSPTGARVG